MGTHNRLLDGNCGRDQGCVLFSVSSKHEQPRVTLLLGGSNSAPLYIAPPLNVGCGGTFMLLGQRQSPLELISRSTLLGDDAAREFLVRSCSQTVHRTIDGAMWHCLSFRRGRHGGSVAVTSEATDEVTAKQSAKTVAPLSQGAGNGTVPSAGRAGAMGPVTFAQPDGVLMVLVGSTLSHHTYLLVLIDQWNRSCRRGSGTVGDR